MPLLRLIAEGVGPFEKLDIDFSDGDGKPHLGPHILAGVNGSGKSTILRTIAWVLQGPSECGFPKARWKQLTAGWPKTQAVLELADLDGRPVTLVRTMNATKTWLDEIRSWLQSGKEMTEVKAETDDPTIRMNRALSGGEGGEAYAWAGMPVAGYPFAAYSPSLSLTYLSRPGLHSQLGSAFENSLAFRSTIQNEAVQAWLLRLYSQRAIASQRGEDSTEFQRSLIQFEGALQSIYGEDVKFEVDLKPTLLPKFRIRGKSLNFSQLPDGVTSTVAWIADFMMRRDQFSSALSAKGEPLGILLLDEIDAHLHPLWQRRVLPAARIALPKVQMIVTSHSPFVISSIAEGCVHVLEVQDGRVSVSRPQSAPFGMSVSSVLKDIFGVESRFDVDTEEKLNEWNELKKDEVRGHLDSKKRRRLNELTEILAARSEELRLIVTAPPKPSQETIQSILNGKRRGGRRAVKTR